MDASSIATIAIVVVATVAVVALALGMFKRLRKPRLEVRLDEVASMGEPLPRHAGRYAARLRIFVSNVGRANARDTNVWLRFDTNHLAPLLKVGALPTTVEDFEVSRVDIRSVRLRSEAILKGGEPATTEVRVEVRSAGFTEIAYRATCDNCALSEGTLSFTAPEEAQREHEEF